MELTGIHHITLVGADAARTLAFYTSVLGMHLVKRPVTFDRPDTFHLYFGDAQGTPGSLITFFEWPDAEHGRTGIGGTHHFALTVESTNAQLKWKRRLADLGIAVQGPYDRTYFRSIYFRDPDGCRVEIATRWPGMTEDEEPDRLGSAVIPPPDDLVRGARDEDAIAAQTWPEPLPEIQPDMALAGLHHISAVSGDIDRTADFWTGPLGLRLVKRTASYDDAAVPHYYFGDAQGAPGTLITYFGYGAGRMPPARLGPGLTHHFALGVESDEQQLAWRERLLAVGIAVTPVRDRQYFHSIYFHDPDGHLLEIATRPPGFAVDEPADRLGQRLMLPPWLEPARPALTARLRPLAP